MTTNQSKAATTVPALIAANKLPTRPLKTECMPSHERDRHRVEIAATVEAMLLSWFQPEMSAAVRTAHALDWTDELEGYKPDQVRKAFAEWRNREPNKRPNPTHIKEILSDRWGRHVLAQAQARGLLAAPEPEARVPVSKERAAEILAAAGFAPRKVEASE